MVPPCDMLVERRICAVCGRYSEAYQRTDREYDEYFKEVMQALGETKPNFNVTPTQKAPVIRLVHGKPVLHELTWNFRPEGLSKGDALPNARAEGLFRSDRHRSSAATRRCLVPATAWYEWKEVTGGKIPHAFRMKTDPLIIFAGIWTRWTDETGAFDDSYAIITTDANALSRPIHKRMPVILTGNDRREWLESPISEPDDVERLQGLLRPYRGSDLDVYPVSTYVNNPGHNDLKCLEPAPTRDQAPDFELNGN